MNHSDIPRLHALRDEYVRKYNENSRWLGWCGSADLNEPPIVMV